MSQEQILIVLAIIFVIYIVYTQFYKSDPVKTEIDKSIVKDEIAKTEITKAIIQTEVAKAAETAAKIQTEIVKDAIYLNTPLIFLNNFSYDQIIHSIVDGKRLATSKETFNLLKDKYSVDTWFAVSDSNNEWMQVGKHTMFPYGKLHSTIGKPVWGLTNSPQSNFKRGYIIINN